MNLFSLFRRPSSAPVARDRLQILLAQDRTGQGFSDLLRVLREDILAVVRRHMDIDFDRVNVQVGHGEKLSMLEVAVEIPDGFQAPRRASRRKRTPVPARRRG